MVFVREDTSFEFLSAESKPLEGMYIELDFCRKKWLLSCSYNPNENNIMSHLNALRRDLYLYCAPYERLILLGDFNVEYETPCKQLLVWIWSWNQPVTKI